MQNIDKIELLAPAGSYESMLAAVANGANAVYLGGNAFSARALATNFTNEEIIKTVKHCHLFNVKVYVTVNTLYSDDQFIELIEYIDFLYYNQVDAVIVQDIGLLEVVKNRYVDFEVHMSTQTSIYNIEGVNYFKNQGVSRVVLARENTLNEIKDICQKTDLDIEVFVHGALCMSYSGQCLFSSLIAKRSGNKGSCGQPCRLKYHLIKNNTLITDNASFLLSPKDLCTIDHIKELIEAGVTSFKIEGRMKRPEYVASVVRQYRKAIDSYFEKSSINNESSVNEMMTMFNRGFTSGHIFDDNHILSKDFPGHRGVKVGSVIGHNENKNTISIKLEKKLRQNDRILFKKTNATRTITKLYSKGNLVNHANAGDIVSIEMNDFIEMNDEVMIIYNYELINLLKKTYINNDIKTKVDCNVQIDVNKNYIQLELICGIHTIFLNSTISIEKATKSPITKERIQQQLSKLGDTPYIMNNCVVKIEDGYIFSIKELNQIRRDAIVLLNDKRLNLYNRVKINPVVNLNNKEHILSRKIVKVLNIEQYKQAITYNDFEIFISIEDDLETAYQYAIKNNSSFNVYTTFLTSSHTIESLIHSKVYKFINTIMVADYRAFNEFKDKKIILDRHFNLYNSYSLKHFRDYDCVMSIECTSKHLKNLNTANNVYVYVYGNIEVMHLKHCIISEHYFGKKIIGCNKCKDGNFCLSDRTKSKFDIIPDSSCNNIIYHDRPIVIEDYQKLNCDGIIINLTIENSKQIKEILNFYLNTKNPSSLFRSNESLKTYGYLKV